MNKQISDILYKEMTRKEFLATLGVGVGTVLGFGSIIRLLTGQQQNTSRLPVANGYGSGAYGGHRI